MLKGWVEKVKGLNKTNKKPHVNNSLANTREREVEEGKGRKNGDGRKLDLGW